MTREGVSANVVGVNALAFVTFTTGVVSRKDHTDASLTLLDNFRCFFAVALVECITLQLAVWGESRAANLIVNMIEAPLVLKTHNRTSMNK